MAGAAGVPVVVGHAITELLRRGAQLNQVYDNARGAYEGAQHVYAAATSTYSALTEASVDPGGEPTVLSISERRRGIYDTPDRASGPVQIFRITPVKRARRSIPVRRARRTSVYVSRPSSLRRRNYRRVSRLGRRRWFRRY